MITVLRHGRTAVNASGRLLGRADPPLDATGRGQAAAVAAELGPVDLVVTSPLLRTRQTAEEIAARRREVDERFVELDYGDWDGRAVGDVTPEEWRSWRDDLTWAPPGGESIAALGRRVRPALTDLVAEGREGHVVVVTHVSPYKAAVAWALGVGDEVAWRLYVAPASRSRIDVGPGGPRLVEFGRPPAGPDGAVPAP